ncbi:MAG: hypothetical protein V7637_6085 [Mycobacteriales bacterium]
MSRRGESDNPERQDRGLPRGAGVHALQQAAGNRAVSGLLAPAGGTPVQRHCIPGHDGPALDDETLWGIAENSLPGLLPLLYKRENQRRAARQQQDAAAHQQYAQTHPQFAPPNYSQQIYAHDQPPRRTTDLLNQRAIGVRPRTGELGQTIRNRERNREIEEVDPRLRSIMPDDLEDGIPGERREED